MDAVEVSGVHLLMVVLVVVSSLVIMAIVGVLTGNITTMYLLNKLGFPVYSGKIQKDAKLLKKLNKDGAGWLHIPDVCYSPILLSRGGYYCKKDMFKKESRHGELYVSDTPSAELLRKISKKSNTDTKIFQDLTLIEGSSAVRTKNLRYAKFTYLRKLLNSELVNTTPVIYLHAEGKLRIFKLLLAVEMGVEDNKSLKLKDRATFIQKLKELAFVDTGLPYGKDIVLIKGNTDIDTLLVALVEVGESNGKGCKNEG